MQMIDDPAGMADGKPSWPTARPEAWSRARLSSLHAGPDAPWSNMSSRQRRRSRRHSAVAAS